MEGFVERARGPVTGSLRGGERWKQDGLWYEPTLIEPSPTTPRSCSERCSGRSSPIQTFEDEDEAIALANSTAVRPLRDRLHRLRGAGATGSVGGIRAGTIWVNTYLVRDLTAPFGGCRISGIGREGGDYALDFHSELKTIQISQGTVS